MWEGRVSAGRVIVLAEQLQLNPHSRCRMIRLGGDPRWIGWDVNSELAAAQHDVVVAFASGKPLTEKTRYPRPGYRPAETSSQLFAPSTADFNVSAFMQIINSG